MGDTTNHLLMEANIYKKSTWICFVAIAFFFAATPLWAQKTEGNQGNNAISPWWGGLETGVIYDDNILQVKNGKESDVIWESIISLSYQPGGVKWSGLAIFDRYLDNSELSYSYYETGAERPFGDRDYGSVFFHVSPNASLDKEDPDRLPFSLSSYGISVSADHDTDRWGNMGFEFSYTRLDYNAPFDAKNTHIITLRPSHFYRVNDFLTLFTEYSYETGDASGGTIFNQEDDISYHAHAFALKLTHQVSKKMKARLSYSIRRKRFTTNSTDLIHAGRKDTRQFFFTQLAYRLREKVQVLGRFDHLWRNSSDPLIEFNENRLMLSATYLF